MNIESRIVYSLCKGWCHLMFRLLFQFLLISFMYFLGNVFVYVFQLSIPGSVVGMVLLFLSLFFGVIKLGWVERVANFHLKHITLLCIPAIVGVFYYLDIFQTEGLKLLFVLITSSLFILGLTAYFVQFFERKEGKE